MEQNLNEMDLHSNAKKFKRHFSEAFPPESSSNLPSKRPFPMDSNGANARENQKFTSDLDALLFVALNQSHTKIQQEASTKLEYADEGYPISPNYSDGGTCPESSSESTVSRHSIDSGSDEEYDYMSDGFHEEEETTEDKGNMITMTKTGVPGARLRVGQHYSKKRLRTNAEQLRILEITYLENKVPNQEIRKDLATRLGMTSRRIQIWFQNKRAKEKRLKNQSKSLSPSGPSPPSSTASTSKETPFHTDSKNDKDLSSSSKMNPDSHPTSSHSSSMIYNMSFSPIHHSQGSFQPPFHDYMAPSFCPTTLHWLPTDIYPLHPFVFQLQPPMVPHPPTQAFWHGRSSI